MLCDLPVSLFFLLEANGLNSANATMTEDATRIVILCGTDASVGTHRRRFVTTPIGFTSNL
jgi:hypothetical protein